MLSEVCRYLNNWFDDSRTFGDFEIEDGVLLDVDLQAGQYFRIIDSVFNDGVYQWPVSNLRDEKFHGAVWALKIPPEIIAISDEIDAWKEKYLGADSAALGPFTSESFGGYSYSKGTTADGKVAGGDWTQVSGFTSRLNGWRRPRCRY